MREIILISEVAKMLSISHDTCRRWAVEGRIPAFRYNGRGQWRAFRDDINKFLETHQAKPNPDLKEGEQQ